MKNRATHSYEYNALCDICQFKFKASQLKKRWDGYMVCEKDFEFRHPLDFYTTRNDAHLLPFVRSDNNGTYIGPLSSNPNPINKQAKADIGIADNATVGFTYG